MYIIYHNSRCSKSREALKVLKDKNVTLEIRNYLTDPLSKDELTSLLDKLGIKPSQLLRKNEKVYSELNLKKVTNEDLLIEKIIEYPKLMERPIVTKGKKAIIGRPIDNLYKILT